MGGRCFPTVPGVHVLFVHRNFPAQFGYLAGELVRRNGWRCTFESETEPGEAAGILIRPLRLSRSNTPCRLFSLQQNLIPTTIVATVSFQVKDSDTRDKSRDRALNQ